MRKLLYYSLVAAASFLLHQQHAAAQDVFKVAPTMYKILSDTLGIRMLEAVYPPGSSSAMHVHPDFALYILEGGQVEITNKKGSKQVVEFKTGQGVVLPADAHTARNVGSTTVRLVVVEINRKRK